MLDKLKQRMAQVAHNAAEAAMKQIDKVKLPDEARNLRLTECEACEHLFKPTSTCKKCGCFVHAKTYLASAECPIGKWKPITIVSHDK